MDTGGTTSQNIQLIRLRDVERILSIGKSTIYAQIQSGKFPKPVKLGTSARWAKHEIEAVALRYLSDRDSKATA